MSVHLVVGPASLFVVRDVGAPSTIRAGTPLMVKKTFLRVISIVTNAASVATYLRTQHHLEPWAGCLVTLSEQTQ